MNLALAISTKLTYPHSPLQNPKFNFKPNYGEKTPNNDDQIDIIPMFEKILTPSDVGKLNRIVIPKLHAERHFPRMEQPSTGILLCFEDSYTAETWHFRYSYWGSSQSYVLTKGWSRFVRQKQLSAGDTISFSSDNSHNCLFISYKHRTSSVNMVKVSSDMNCRTRKTDQRYSDVTFCTDKIVVDFNSDTTYCGRSQKRVRLFGVNLDFREPVESNCSLLLDLKL